TTVTLKNYKITTAEREFFAKEPQEKKQNLDLKITGKYYALLIGNSKYEKPEWSSLTSPVNDVSEIGKILETKYNFEDVLIVKNANRDEMFEAFEKLTVMTTDKDYVLIYYAGHGDVKGNKSYWIPVDAQKSSIRNWINLSDIENYLIDIPAHHLAVMVDSCYFSVSKGNNTISEKPKNMLYQKLLKKRARIILSSGQNEPVDDTGVGKHSIFAMSFINSLKNNNIISLQNIGYDIGLAHAGMRQSPYFRIMYNWGHNNGDFVFVSKK
ncbi:caspase family protein, partial [Candidatus Pelagibacter sp.]|nr:caspase family protein [Candidatus Pelagibacter sp.]